MRIELTTNGRAVKARITGLDQEQLDAARRAQDDYDAHGDEFEKVCYESISGALRAALNALSEANFWVEGDALIFDTGD